MAPSKPRSVIRQLCHWGPIVALSLIGVVVVSATYSSVQLYSLPSVKYIKKFNFFTMYFNLSLILYSYFKAFGGPGFVPIKWKPVSINAKNKHTVTHLNIGGVALIKRGVLLILILLFL